MTAAVFVVAQQDLTGLAPGARVRVAGPEGRHGATVRRLRIGEAVDLVDGEGLRVRGEVAAVPGPGEFEVAVAEVSQEPPADVRVTVVLALLKGERMDSAVEMLTEVGVDEIVPWAAARSVVRWQADRRARGEQRLAAALVAAGKQSRRARFPKLAPVAGTAEVCGRLGAATAALVLDEGAEQRLAGLQLAPAGEIALVVGPEGGIAEEERAAFLAAGARAVRMGPSVLRAGTAAAAAGALVMAGAGRWD